MQFERHNTMEVELDPALPFRARLDLQLKRALTRDGARLQLPRSLALVSRLLEYLILHEVENVRE